MHFVVTNRQMKAAEENADKRGTSYLNLMENAGKACFSEIKKLCGEIKGKNTVILCGRGNNGGDGIVIAKAATDCGANAIVIYVVDLPKSECARKCYSMYEGSINSVLYSYNEAACKMAICSCDILVDCVYGTGFHGSLDEKTALVFDFVNQNCNALKISVDVPSGINSDNGNISGSALKPDVTLCLGAIKTGLLSHPAFDFCGNIVLLDIGITADDFTDYTAKLTDSSIKACLPKRTKSSHKGTYGKLLNISGSSRFVGAAMLSTRAALRTGVGLSVLAAPKSVVSAICGSIAETTYLPLYEDEDGFIDCDCTDLLDDYLPLSTAVLVGCGLGMSEETRIITEYVLKHTKCPLLIDADGINSIAENINVLGTTDASVILTPHPAEFSRLTGLSVKDIQHDRLNTAKAFAATTKTVVVLKGANTVIAAPDGRMYVNTTGNPGLAKGGSGDVLSGIIASLAAQGTDPFEAAVCGVYLHGLAADTLAQKLNIAGILPSDIVEILPLI